MPKIIFHIDMDTDVIDERGWEKDWIETRRLILKYLGFKLIKWIKQPSLYRPKKKLKKGRGYHYFFHCEGPKITNIERIRTNFLLGDCSGRVFLSKLKAERGEEIFEKLFSEVRYRKPPSKRCSECRLRKNIIELVGSKRF